MAFTIQYSPEAANDIRALRVFDARIIMEAIGRHLLNTPSTLAGSRIKRMIQPFWSQFRLQVGDFRVYYDVNEVNGLVNVLRVLHKGTGSTPSVPP